MNALLERPDTVMPTAKDTEMAAEASRAIAKTKEADFRVKIEGGVELLLPRAAKDLLFHLLKEMALGNAVTIIPVHAELTTQEAADILNVSRPHLVSLLEQKKIAFHKVGTHRRIKFADLEAYRKAFEQERRKAMDALAEQAQELEMGYENVKLHRTL